MHALRSLWSVIVEAASRWLDDACYRLGASLAYYALFSLFPLLLLLVTIFGSLLGDSAAAREQIVSWLAPSGDIGARALLHDVVESMQQHRSSRALGFAVGTVTLLFGASAVFAELSFALNTIWRAPQTPMSGLAANIVDFIKQRLRAFALVGGTGLLVFVFLVTSTVLAALGSSASKLPFGALFWQLIELAASFALLTSAVAATYRVVPRLRIDWRDVWPGAALGALLVTLLRRLVASFLAAVTGYATYGVVGAVLGLLTYIYLTSLALFFGAEVARVYAERYGSLAPRERSGPRPPG